MQIGCQFKERINQTPEIIHPGEWKLTLMTTGLTILTIYQTANAENGSIYIISHSEYLAENPVQSALRSYRKQKAKKKFNIFLLGMILRPKVSRNQY